MNLTQKLELTYIPTAYDLISNLFVILKYVSFKFYEI